jgi:5,10-methylenetetrahydromethanopterin reductase
VTAGAARTVAELAPGRLEIGFGAGDSAVSHIGRRSARSADLESAVDAVRLLLHGKEVADEVHPWTLVDPIEVPVLIGASRPRNLEMSGRIADGAIIPGIAWERGCKIVRDGAVAAGRNPDALSYIMMRSCAITDDPQRDAVIFKPSCLRHAQMVGTAIFEEAGVPIDAPPHDLTHGDLGHPKSWDEAVRISSEWVTDEAALWYARTHALFGTPEQVAEQLADLEAAGVQRLLLAQLESFRLPVRLIDSLIDGVLPIARGEGVVASR